MAEDAVVKENLSKEMIAAGKGLVRELDRRQRLPNPGATTLYAVALMPCHRPIIMES